MLNNFLKANKTVLTLPSILFFSKRFTGSKKALECVGKACNEGLKSMAKTANSAAPNTAVNSTNDPAVTPTSTPEATPKAVAAKPKENKPVDSMVPEIKTGKVDSTYDKYSQQMSNTQPSSSGYSATSPLGTANTVSKTTLNVENKHPVPNTHIRGYVTPPPPPGQGYSVFQMDHTTEPHPTKTGKTIQKPNVVDATGQEIPVHEASHMVIRDNQQEKMLGYLPVIKIHLKDLNLLQIIMWRIKQTRKVIH